MPKEYRILILCGTGIATSTAIRQKIEKALRDAGLAQGVTVRQGKVADVLGGNVNADLIVATAQVPSNVKVTTINGVPLLTGVGAQPVLQQIVAKVRERATA